MTIRTDSKETNTTDDNKKGSAELTSKDECPTESDKYIAATVEEEPTQRDYGISPGEAACFDRTTSDKLLKVDRAYNWGPGTEMYDDRDNAIFGVVFQGCAGVSGGVPIYEAMIMEIETRQPVAYVRKGIEVFRETYHIYTAYPNYSSQPITRLDDMSWYALGTLRQSMFGKNYAYKICHGLEFKTAMNASNGRIRWALLLCMIPFMCPRWHLKFYNVGDQKNPAIIRNQGDNTLTVAPDENLLEAICISYAVDRLTNPCTKEAWGRSGNWISWRISAYWRLNDRQRWCDPERQKYMCVSSCIIIHNNNDV
jgi:hypothetical protein